MNLNKIFLNLNNHDVCTLNLRAMPIHVVKAKNGSYMILIKLVLFGCRVRTHGHYRKLLGVVALSDVLSAINSILLYYNSNVSYILKHFFRTKKKLSFEIVRKKLCKSFITTVRR